MNPSSDLKGSCLQKQALQASSFQLSSSSRPSFPLQQLHFPSVPTKNDDIVSLHPTAFIFSSLLILGLAFFCFASFFNWLFDISLGCSVVASAEGAGFISTFCSGMGVFVSGFVLFDENNSYEHYVSINCPKQFCLINLELVPSSRKSHENS